MCDRPAPCTTVRHTSAADRVRRLDMRFMNIKQTRAGRPRRLISYLLRRRCEPPAASPVDRFDGFCFGSVGKREQLALEGFIAGQELLPAGRRPSPDRDRTDRPASSRRAGSRCRLRLRVGDDATDPQAAGQQTGRGNHRWVQLRDRPAAAESGLGAGSGPPRPPPPASRAPASCWEDSGWRRRSSSSPGCLSPGGSPRARPRIRSRSSAKNSATRRPTSTRS